jgi:hypothetical protein
MAAATPSVECTMSGDSAFGMMCRPRIRRSGTPTLRAAVTNS